MTPATARMHPQILWLLKVVYRKILVKITVETMTMLLVMLRTEPER
jgi:hypothetical protein